MRKIWELLKEISMPIWCPLHLITLQQPPLPHKMPKLPLDLHGQEILKGSGCVSAVVARKEVRQPNGKLTNPPRLLVETYDPETGKTALSTVSFLVVAALNPELYVEIVDKIGAFRTRLSRET